MTLPMRLLDDLSGSDIPLNMAYKWYGEDTKLNEIILHLLSDNKISVYMLKHGQQLRMEKWELENLFREMNFNAALKEQSMNIYLQLV